MIQTAVFGTEKVILAGLCRFEPKIRIAARDDVRLCSKGRNVEIMQHVLGRHRELYTTADRNVELIDLTLARLVLDLPHPLLADDVDRDGVLRGALDFGI